MAYYYNFFMSCPNHCLYDMALLRASTSDDLTFEDFSCHSLCLFTTSGGGPRSLLTTCCITQACLLLSLDWHLALLNVGQCSTTCLPQVSHGLALYRYISLHSLASTMITRGLPLCIHELCLSWSNPYGFIELHPLVLAISLSIPSTFSLFLSIWLHMWYAIQHLGTKC